MTLPIILGFLFGFLLGLVVVLLLTGIAIHHEKAKYEAICRDIELWKSFMEETAQKKHSPAFEEVERHWKQRWPYKDNRYEPLEPTL